MTQKNMKKPVNNDKVAGRQRLTWPVLEGIGAVASMLKVPEALIKQVKRSGSKAFLTHNRIDSGILIPELFVALAKSSELPEGIASPQDWLAIEKAKRESIKRQQDEKSVMPTAEAQRQAALACAFVDAELQRGENELPPVLAGRDAVECGKLLHSFTEKVRTNAKEKFGSIGH